MLDSVIVVCTGNICRSPMAYGLLRQAALSRGWNLQVDSAGLAALAGERPDSIAVKLLAERGIDISAHVAKQAKRELLSRFALILTMERMQQEFVVRTWPTLRGRVFRWGQAQDFDVPDPYGRDEPAFRATLAAIDKGLPAWLAQLGKDARAEPTPPRV